MKVTLIIAVAAVQVLLCSGKAALERVERATSYCDTESSHMHGCTLVFASTLQLKQTTTMTDVILRCSIWQTTSTCIETSHDLYMNNVQVTTAAETVTFLYVKGGANLMMERVIVSGFTAPATLDHGGDPYGAVLYVDEPGSNIMINDCTFEDNSVQEGGFGGAIYLKGATLTMTHTDFYRNAAPGGGGAIALVETTATISESTFDGCTSTQGGERIKKEHAGGAVYLTNSDLTMSKCTFHNNFASWEGGAIVMYKSSMTVWKTKFTENEAEAVAALAINDSKMVIDSCHFEKNRGTIYGGAIGIWFDDSVITMVKNTFKDNFAPEGKGPDYYCEAKDNNYIYVTQIPAISDAQSWDEPYHETLPEGGSCNTNKFYKL